MTKPDFEKTASDVWWEHGACHKAMAIALREAYAAGLERAAEICTDDYREYSANAQEAADAIRAEKEVER